MRTRTIDWIAGIVQLLAAWMVSNKRKNGHLLFMLGEVGWIYVAIDKQVYGLLMLVFPAMFINVRNYLKWLKQESS